MWNTSEGLAKELGLCRMGGGKLLQLVVVGVFPLYVFNLGQFKYGFRSSIKLIMKGNG